MTLPSAIVLDELAFIRVAGADAVGFLQGQLSSDLRLLTAERGQISSYSTPKGRMLAVLQLFRQGEDILIELHRSVAEATLKRLRMFVLRSKLTLDDVSAARPALAVLGEDAATQLRAWGLPAPEEPLATAESSGLLIVRRLGEAPRYSLHGDPMTLRALAPSLPVAGFSAWKRADLLAGVPTVYPETRELFVPQMANLDLLGGIGLNKGCYTGQEIVARLHYLGQLKRRLFLCRSAVGGVAPGTPVYDGAGDAQAVGEVVDAVDEQGGALVTAVLQLTHAQSAQLRLGTAGAGGLSVIRSFVS